MEGVFVSSTGSCTRKLVSESVESTLTKSIARFPSLPIHQSTAPELVIGDPECPAYREIYAEKHWTDTSNQTRCEFYHQKIKEYRRRTGQPEYQGPWFEGPVGGIELKRRNSVRIPRREYNKVPRDCYMYPDSPWLLQDDPEGTEVKRLGLVPINKQASEISQVRSGETDDAHASWRRRIVKVIRRQKKDKKPVVKKDLADIEFDEEVLKEKYLKGLKKRKRFPCFLTYKISFLRRFRPTLELENKYSPMEIPDEVYARYFRGVKNPWDYGASPLPFWTPPEV